MQVRSRWRHILFSNVFVHLNSCGKQLLSCPPAICSSQCTHRITSSILSIISVACIDVSLKKKRMKIKGLTRHKVLSREMRRKSRLWSSRADPIPDLRKLYLTAESLRGLEPTPMMLG